MAKLLGRAEHIAWLRLARTPRVGALTFHRLIARFGTAEAALEALPRYGRGELKPPSISSIEDELAGDDKLGAQIHASCETLYPRLLAQLETPPPVLSIRGRSDLFTGASIAIVESAADVIAAPEAAPNTISRAPRQWRLFEQDEPFEPQAERVDSSALATQLANLLSPTPMHLNDLARLLNGGAGAVAAALTELELEGRAASLPGGYASSS